VAVLPAARSVVRNFIGTSLSLSPGPIRKRPSAPGWKAEKGLLA